MMELWKNTHNNNNERCYGPPDNVGKPEMFMQQTKSDETPPRFSLPYRKRSLSLPHALFPLSLISYQVTIFKLQKSDHHLYLVSPLKPTKGNPFNISLSLSLQ